MWSKIIENECQWHLQNEIETFLEMRLFKARLLMFVNFSCKWDGDSIIYKTYMYIFNFIIRFLCSEIYLLFQGLSQYLISWKMMRLLKEQWKITRQGWNYLIYRLTSLESFWYSRTFFKGLGDLENEVKFFFQNGYSVLWYILDIDKILKKVCPSF